MVHDSAYTEDMSFDETAVRRDITGRFAEKTGTSPEVLLSASPKSQVRVPMGHTLFPNGTVDWDHNGGLTQDDFTRVYDFVSRTGMRMTGKATRAGNEDGVQYAKVHARFPDGRSVPASSVIGGVSAEQHVASIVASVRHLRSVPGSERQFKEHDKHARELLGGEYDAIVNPAPKKRPFLQRVFGD